MSFSAEKLSSLVEQLAGYQKIWVALSGGLDSIVLLHAVHHLRSICQDSLPTLAAIHVNHQLQKEAGHWQSFCTDFCQQLSIPLQIEKASIEIGAGPSLEALARQARYDIFESVLDANHCLLMAHHVDDQMETLLLRLMRGAGSRGLRGIPARRQLGDAMLYRPLLDFTRLDLQLYAEANALQWIEDPSNQDRRIDRNYCRHEILPKIESRWPAYRDSWRKAATLAGEAEELLQEFAHQDLIGLATDHATVLNLSKFSLFSDVRQRNILKHWLQQHGIEAGWNLLHQLNDKVIKAKDDIAMLRGEAWEIHRYRAHLYLLQQIPALGQNRQFPWNPHRQQQFSLPENGLLQAVVQTNNGLRVPEQESLRVLTRQGGETLRIAGRPTKTLKKLLQEHGVQPWLRPRLPLLYLGDQLVCVPGIGVNEEFRAGPGEQGLTISWQAPSLAYTRFYK